MDFSELSLPQKVAAHELTLRTLQDEVRASRALLIALIDVVTSPAGSPEYEAALTALLAERKRI